MRNICLFASKFLTTGFTCKKCLLKFSPKVNELEKKGLSVRKYEEELHELKVVRRKEVAQKIKEAREQGD